MVMQRAYLIAIDQKADLIVVLSERGFTSKQRKKVIYGREKYRNRRNKRAE